MRQYRIDQLTPEDQRRIAGRLAEMELGAGLDGIYWLPVPPALLTPLQQEHAPDCGPYVMSVELEGDALTLELLVRGRGRLRCECVGYASPALQEHMLGYVDGMLRDLGISF